jgi:hypothetical protein
VGVADTAVLVASASVVGGLEHHGVISARLRLRVCAAAPIEVCVQDSRTTLRPGGRFEVPLRGW